MNPRFAARLIPARDDLAAAHLRGQVSAERFVEGAPCRVAAPLLALTGTPAPDAERASELIFGQAFTVYEIREDGWAWGQAALDGYVGYVRAEGLEPGQDARVRVTARLVPAPGPRRARSRRSRRAPPGPRPSRPRESRRR